jgi:large subunit ribosomal protein L10
MGDWDSVMSKEIKQLQMDVLAKTFEGVRDMVFLSTTKIDSTTENKIRIGLRKKNVSLMMVKNSLLRRVFAESELQIGDDIWVGPTLIAWGAESVKDLSKAIDAALVKDEKLKGKVTVKATLAEGLPVPFEQAMKMPTRKEAIGEIVAAFMGPASGIASALSSAAAQIASQIQSIAEKKPDEPPASAG